MTDIHFADPRFPQDAQFALRVEQGTLGPMAPQGSTILCLDIVGDFAPEVGDTVLVKVYGEGEGEDATSGRFELRRYNGDGAERLTTPLVGEASAEDDDFIVMGVVLRIEKPVMTPRIALVH